MKVTTKIFIVVAKHGNTIDFCSLCNFSLVRIQYCLIRGHSNNKWNSRKGAGGRQSVTWTFLPVSNLILRLLGRWLLSLRSKLGFKWHSLYNSIQNSKPISLEMSRGCTYYLNISIFSSKSNFIIGHRNVRAYFRERERLICKKKWWKKCRFFTFSHRDNGNR